LKIFIEHPLKIFLARNFDINDKSKKQIFPNIPFCLFNNWDSYVIDEKNKIKTVPGNYAISNFIDYLKHEPEVISGSAFIYNTIYPMSSISENHKKVMQHIFEPNEEMKQYIEKTIMNLGIIKHNYIVIHIRTGDSYLITEKNELYVDYIRNLTLEINNSIKEDNDDTSSIKYVIITDNNNVKHMLLKFFPQFIGVFNKISSLLSGKN
jgi:hypothetical protein